MIIEQKLNEKLERLDQMLERLNQMDGELKELLKKIRSEKHGRTKNGERNYRRNQYGAFTYK